MLWLVYFFLGLLIPGCHARSDTGNAHSPRDHHVPYEEVKDASLNDVAFNHHQPSRLASLPHNKDSTQIGDLTNAKSHTVEGETGHYRSTKNRGDTTVNMKYDDNAMSDNSDSDDLLGQGGDISISDIPSNDLTSTAETKSSTSLSQKTRDANSNINPLPLGSASINPDTSVKRVALKTKLSPLTSLNGSSPAYRPIPIPIQTQWSTVSRTLVTSSSQNTRHSGPKSQVTQFRSRDFPPAGSPVNKGHKSEGLGAGPSDDGVRKFPDTRDQERVSLDAEQHRPDSSNKADALKIIQETNPSSVRTGGDLESSIVGEKPNDIPNVSSPKESQRTVSVMNVDLDGFVDEGTKYDVRNPDVSNIFGGKTSQSLKGNDLVYDSDDDRSESRETASRERHENRLKSERGNVNENHAIRAGNLKESGKGENEKTKINEGNGPFELNIDEDSLNAGRLDKLHPWPRSVINSGVGKHPPIVGEKTAMDVRLNRLSPGVMQSKQRTMESHGQKEMDNGSSGSDFKGRQSSIETLDKDISEIGNNEGLKSDNPRPNLESRASLANKQGEVTGEAIITERHLDVMTSHPIETKVDSFQVPLQSTLVGAGYEHILTNTLGGAKNSLLLDPNSELSSHTLTEFPDRGFFKNSDEFDGGAADSLFGTGVHTIGSLTREGLDKLSRGHRRENGKIFNEVMESKDDMAGTIEMNRGDDVVNVAQEYLRLRTLPKENENDETFSKTRQSKTLGVGKDLEAAYDHIVTERENISPSNSFSQDPLSSRQQQQQQQQQSPPVVVEGEGNSDPPSIQPTAANVHNHHLHVGRIKRSADKAKESSGQGTSASSSSSSEAAAYRPPQAAIFSGDTVLLTDNTTNPDLPVIKIGVILTKLRLPWSYEKTRTALEIAAHKIRAPDGPLPHYTIQMVYRDSKCSEIFGVLEAIDLYVRKMAHVFIGPGCDYPTAPIARYSAYWGDGIPILSAAAMVSAFRDKQNEFKLLTRVQGSYLKMSSFMMNILHRFGWKTVGIAFHDKQYDGQGGRSNCYFSVEPIFLSLKKEAEPYHVAFDDRALDGKAPHDLLMKLKANSRIIVMCAKPNAVREIMIKAHQLNFDNGEYVFFYIDLFHTYKEIARSWYKEGDTDERNAMALKAYEALMIVVLRMPTSDEYKQFSVDVKARAAAMFPNFTYGEEEVNSFVGAFHDAVLLYAIALNETLAQNGSINDGEAITKRMWNRTFVGITGNVSIDSNGDRNADYSLLDLNPLTKQFEVVANYFGNTREYKPVEGKSIHWAGGRTEPPPDTPKCGFDGSKCPPDEPFPEYAIVIIVLGSILLIVLIAVFFIYRHIKLEAELKEMNWRVRWDDILFGAMEKNRKLEQSGSRKASIPSECSGDTIAVHLNDAGNRQLFTKTGYYRGAIMAIKPIHRASITISKPMLLEIKRIKDLQNDHVVRFLGACIDHPNLCVLTEYCPKGSLQDVLENDQIKLDWMFRYSIMQDIVRGMAYLQSTEVRSHGSLKSTNCVVDSRFVVKITDFGLHHLKGQPSLSEEEEDSYSFYHKQLWTAPELLRMSVRPPEGTLKADMYSFGIICQEIVYRNGVFYLQNLDLSPKEIHQKVRNGLRPWFRPTLEEYDCPCDELAEVIRRCWSEEPTERPDFQALKSIIRKLNLDGDKGNILDNLLSRMEQYANNLEALVEERTADYLQQKKKAEDLLYNMLPKKVAGQLIRGECVTAVWYDSVSIYFSDICGFTAMSAECTPMQVVDLLNDLYTAFDSIIENFDVYKVETIGDAYMVVSGLPDRNGTLHAREIARMSLSLLKATMTFRIRHRPTEQLKLRIGIHTGPVCAGVVGLKMPRYCLFGDTVNTTSRMESNGLPLKIHVSPVCKEVLDTFNTFELECRGNVEMKGKGVVKTYWLNGEKNASDSPGVSLNIL